MTVDLNLYRNFVEGVTSDKSNDLNELIKNLQELAKTKPDLNVSLLMTGGIGLSSEAGEFNEIVKKMLFQGKPWNEETKFHLFRELGDIAWYWVSACRAIGVDPGAVIEENVKKLESRYPGGVFNVHSSENRKTDDL